MYYVKRKAGNKMETDWKLKLPRHLISAARGKKHHPHSHCPLNTCFVEAISQTLWPLFEDLLADDGAI